MNKDTIHSKRVIEAIIFDFDGTILDTESAGHEAWLQIFAEQNLEFPFELWMHNIGKVDTFLPENYLKEHIETHHAAKYFRDQRESLKMEIIKDKQLFPGVVDRISEAKSLGLKLGVASSSSANWLNYHLPRIGLLYEFQAVRGSSDVGGKTKPDPAVFNYAGGGVGGQPQNAIAFEDSEAGVTAAKEAGMYAVAIPNELTKLLSFDRADLIIDSLGNHTLIELIDQLGLTL
ncbi:MAG: HAD family phosphatase [Chloroflexota bacterium]